MFRSMIIISELVLHLAKIILKHSENYFVIYVYCVVMWQHAVGVNIVSSSSLRWAGHVAAL